MKTYIVFFIFCFGLNVIVNAQFKKPLMVERESREMAVQRAVYKFQYAINNKLTGIYTDLVKEGFVEINNDNNPAAINISDKTQLFYLNRIKLKLVSAERFLLMIARQRYSVI